ncbi:MAG: LacI family DNA-binding transcriptional regulator [Planctomycetota bacterium]
MATLEDIANRAGVSPKTVSNVLTGRLQATRKDAVVRARNIRRIAVEMGYRPNTAARAMSTGRFNALALIHGSNVGRRFMPERLWTGLHEAAQTHAQHILTAMLPDAQLSDPAEMPQLLQVLAADGLLIDYIHEEPQAMNRLIDQHNLPAMWLNHKRACDCVYPDEVWSGRVMTEQLVKRGHKRIVYVTRRDDSHYCVADRWEGYSQTMREAGLQPERVLLQTEFVSENGPPVCGQACYELISRPDQPTAYVTQESSSAKSLILMAARRGLRVPQDLSIVTISDNHEFDLGFEISLARQFFSQVGRVAIAKLLEKIDNPCVSIEPVAIEGVWREGSTIGPPRN